MPRIIVSLPIHPALFIAYVFIVLPLILVSQVVVIKVFTYLGFSLALGILVSFTMFYLSLLLSPFNIVLKELGTGTYTIRYETRYVYFYGIPIPVIGRRIVENKVMIALNIGGALIPLLVSILMLYGIITRSPSSVLGVVSALIVTAIVTYLVAKPVPGVGIAVPTFIPPIIAVTASLLLIGPSRLLLPVAYIAGTLGSLVGADILRLLKDKDKFINILGPGIVSIGGAGTFDGIYLSGLLAMIIAFIIV